jgi:hypothetical protein
VSEQTCTAADGKTVVYSIPGYPLMVRAVDFNALFGSTHHAAPGAPQQKFPEWWDATKHQLADRGYSYRDFAMFGFHAGAASRAAATAPAGGMPGVLSGMTAAYMDFCRDRAPDHNEVGFAYFKAAWEARAALQAARAAEPEGWKLVPINPTVEMQDACLSLVDLTQGDPEDHRYDDGRKTAEQLYAAMLAASPQPPTGAEKKA